jgi:hypothetical protein
LRAWFWRCTSYSENNHIFTYFTIAGERYIHSLACSFFTICGCRATLCVTHLERRYSAMRIWRSCNYGKFVEKKWRFVLVSAENCIYLYRIMKAWSSFLDQTIKPEIYPKVTLHL